MTLPPARRGGSIRRRALIAGALAAAIVAPVGYVGWRAGQPSEEALLNCSIATPRVPAVPAPGVVTFRPSTRLESGFAISYSEEFSVGSNWTLGWNSSRPGLRAVFLYDAGGGLTDRDPRIANESGRIAFWWNDLVARPNTEPIADSPWASRVDMSRPGRFCVTLLETSGSSSDWTVTITDKS